MTATRLVCAGVLCAAAAGAATPAFAQSNTDLGLGPFVSGGYTYFNFDGDNDLEADINAVTARAGFRVTPFLSVEADASFGVDDGEFDFDGDEDEFDLDDNDDGDLDDILAAPGDVEMDYLVAAFAKASVPITPRFEVGARGGYAFVELDGDIATPFGNEISVGGSDDGFGVGANAQVNLTKRQALRLDYTYYDFDEVEANAVTIAYQFTFAP